ncbi:mucin-2-like, partial [Anastrepha ludens]|uniref:mucin-2-like n=1 Tax=Anastrepha ludens TaxID=28586 RepID=UPI0023B0E281
SVSFDDDCSQVQCPPETSTCPPDSVELQPPPVIEMLYGPDEFMPPHEFYDDADDSTAPIDQHYDELPLHESAVTIPSNTSSRTASTSPTNTTLSELPNSLAAKVSDAEKDLDPVRMKRELSFDNENTDGIDEHEELMRMCCATMTEENRRRRRRRRRSSTTDDCECKPCSAIPQCPNDEVAIKVHEAAGTPGDCCPTYTCAPKPKCDDVDAQAYWRDSCTRCSCYGAKGIELCHNECPEMEEQEAQRSCFSAHLQEPMLHGSDWYENDFCTKCHCENGVRECVESLCKPVTCSNPIKVPGQCCPQCPTSEENILIARENSTHSSNTSSTEQVRQSEMKTSTIAVSSLFDERVTTETTTVPTLSSNATIGTTSTESSTEPIGARNQTTSTEAITELMYSSTVMTETSASSTEMLTTSRQIDDIAAEIYFGPVSNPPIEDSSASTQEKIDEVSESAPQPSTAAQADTTSSTTPSQVEITEPSATTTTERTSSQMPYIESSTKELSISTETTKVLSTTLSISTEETISTTATIMPNERVSTSKASQENAATSNTTESTIQANSRLSEVTTTQSDYITGSTTMSPTTASPTTASPTTTSPTTTSPTSASSNSASPASVVAVDISSTHTNTASTSLPDSSTAKPLASLTSTTSSPYSSTSAPPIASTTVYWYTFSTSAPSPPVPQPTVYQPSVRTFFTRPEVRYIGATVFFAFLAICALAVWKFCMPPRSTRLKNRYRTVPSSEATSLSHSPTTSHSSMA